MSSIPPPPPGPPPAPPPVPGPGPAYPAYGGLAVPARRVSGLAVASLVLGLVGFLTCGVASILAVIFGPIALSQIKQRPQELSGRGMAIAGLVLGIVMLVLVVVAIAFGSVDTANNGRR